MGDDDQKELEYMRKWKGLQIEETQRMKELLSSKEQQIVDLEREQKAKLRELTRAKSRIERLIRKTKMNRNLKNGDHLPTVAPLPRTLTAPIPLNSMVAPL